MLYLIFLKQKPVSKESLSSKPVSTSILINPKTVDLIKVLLFSS